MIIGITDWAKFAHEWRLGYVVNTYVRAYHESISLNLFNLHHRRRIADGGQGPSSVDVMHREV